MEQEKKISNCITLVTKKRFYRSRRCRCFSILKWKQHVPRLLVCKSLSYQGNTGVMILTHISLKRLVLVQRQIEGPNKKSSGEERSHTLSSLAIHIKIGNFSTNKFFHFPWNQGTWNISLKYLKRKTQKAGHAQINQQTLSSSFVPKPTKAKSRAYICFSLTINNIYF